MAITNRDRKEIFEKLEKYLAACSPPVVAKKDGKELSYESIGNKAVPYGSTKKMIPGMFFASIAQRKDSVAFHFFPCYMNPAMQEVAPTLYKHLKGKTCFHFKKAEDINEKELKALLKKGLAVWKKMGYVE